MKDLREKLIHIFQTLHDFHSTLGKEHGANQATKYRISSYAKIIQTLQSIDHPIYSANDLKGLPNIGASTLEKITTIQRTSTLPFYEEIRKNREYKILLAFQKIRGVGAQRAYQIYKDGYRNISSLKRDVLKGIYHVDDHIKASLLYMKSLNQKIPHDEIRDFGNYLRNTYKMDIIHSGSYRMGKPFSGDIDLLCVIEKKVEAKEALRLIEHLCVHIYNSSVKKINAIIMNPLTQKIHQMDMLFVYPKEVPWMLLYFGSGKEFSKKIRAHALKKGYRLNEHGLYDLRNGKRVKFDPKSEEEIFDYLELTYVKPEHR